MLTALVVAIAILLTVTWQGFFSSSENTDPGGSPPPTAEISSPPVPGTDISTKSQTAPGRTQPPADKTVAFDWVCQSPMNANDADLRASSGEGIKVGRSIFFIHDQVEIEPWLIYSTSQRGRLIGFYITQKAVHPQGDVPKSANFMLSTTSALLTPNTSTSLVGRFGPEFPTSTTISQGDLVSGWIAFEVPNNFYLETLEVMIPVASVREGYFSPDPVNEPSAPFSVKRASDSTRTLLHLLIKQEEPIDSAGYRPDSFIWKGSRSSSWGTRYFFERALNDPPPDFLGEQFQPGPLTDTGWPEGWISVRGQTGRLSYAVEIANLAQSPVTFTRDVESDHSRLQSPPDPVAVGSKTDIAGLIFEVNEVSDEGLITYPDGVSYRRIWFQLEMNSEAMEGPIYNVEHFEMQDCSGHVYRSRGLTATDGTELDESYFAVLNGDPQRPQILRGWVDFYLPPDIDAAPASLSFSSELLGVFVLAHVSEGDWQGGQAVPTGLRLGAPSYVQTSPPPGPLVITSVSFEGPDSEIVVENRGTVQKSLSHWILAANGKQWELPDSFTLQPGETLTIGYGGGADSEGVAYINGVLEEPDPAGGELGLYFESGDTEDRAAMRQYLQWGAPGQPLAQVAIEAGLWVEGLAVEITEGQILSYDQPHHLAAIYSAS